MPEGRYKSCYVLELRAGAGGARLEEYYVSTRLDEIAWVVQRRIPEEVYLLTYDAIRFNLLVVQRGEIAERIDLHPILRFRLEGLRPFRMLGSERFDPPELGPRVKTWWEERDFVGHGEGEIEWTRVAIPELEGELLTDDEWLGIQARPSDRWLTWIGYGKNDPEHGDEPHRPWHDDEWVAPREIDPR